MWCTQLKSKSDIHRNERGKIKSFEIGEIKTVLKFFKPYLDGYTWVSFKLKVSLYKLLLSLPVKRDIFCNLSNLFSY